MASPPTARASHLATVSAVSPPGTLPIFLSSAYTATLFTLQRQTHQFTHDGDFTPKWSPADPAPAVHMVHRTYVRCVPGPVLWQLAKRPSGSDLLSLLFLLAQIFTQNHLSSSNFVRSEIALVASPSSILFLSPLQSSQGLNAMLPLTCQHVNPRNSSMRSGFGLRS